MYRKQTARIVVKPLTITVQEPRSRIFAFRSVFCVYVLQSCVARRSSDVGGGAASNHAICNSQPLLRRLRSLASLDADLLALRVTLSWSCCSGQTALAAVIKITLAWKWLA